MPGNEFAWEGCSENVEYGIKRSKDFLDTRYKKKSDMKTLVKLHNYVAGRLVSLIIILVLKTNETNNHRQSKTIFTSTVNVTDCLDPVR